MKKQKIRICFRLVKGHGDVVAIFLDQERKNMLTCYEHIGQHGDCHKTWVNDCTFPCNKENYKELLDELTEIYDDSELVVVKIQKL